MILYKCVNLTVNKTIIYPSQGGITMKNKLFKTLLPVTLFVVLGLVFNSNSVNALCKTDDKTSTIIIYNETPGNLYNDNLIHSISSNYKKIKISGDINKSDLNSLSCFTSDYTSIDISNTTIPEIERSTFCYKYNLKEFFCPNNLKTIGRDCFINCPNLTKLVIPDSLESINDGSFQFCPNLNLDVPPSVAIGKRVFYECPCVKFNMCKQIIPAKIITGVPNKIEDNSFITNIWELLTKPLFG